MTKTFKWEVGFIVDKLAAAEAKCTAELELITGHPANEGEPYLRFNRNGIYFQHNRQKPAPEHTIAIGVSEGPPVQVQFQNRYAEGIDRSRLSSFFTDEQLAQYFREAFQVKIDGGKLPLDNAQAFIDELSALAEKFGCVDAFTIKPQFKPAKEFHDARHQFLTPEQNVALQTDFCPIIASVKTTGTSRKAA